MTLVLAQKERGLTRTIQALDADGDVITPGVHDKIRVRIGREGEDEVFTVTSGTPTANGSSITAGSSSTLDMVPADLAFNPGAYTMFVDYWDNADARWKEVDRECFVLEHTS